MASGLDRGPHPRGAVGSLASSFAATTLALLLDTLLRVGDELHEGEIVLTGSGAHVEIVLADGTVQPIGPDQQVSMTAELSPADYPGADEAQVASVDTLVQAGVERGDELHSRRGSRAGPPAAAAGACCGISRFFRYWPQSCRCA